MIVDPFADIAHSLFPNPLHKRIGRWMMVGSTQRFIEALDRRAVLMRDNPPKGVASLDFMGVPVMQNDKLPGNFVAICEGDTLLNIIRFE